MDEKQRVISVLRALLLSNCKKDGTPLRVLKQDYSFHEGKQEIPLFEHKSVIDFLISTGEFILNVDLNGLVTVREKPKLLHKKCLLTEPKSLVTGSSCSNEDSNNDVVVEKIKMKSPSSATALNINRSGLVTTVSEKSKLLQKKSLVTEPQSFVTDSTSSNRNSTDDVVIEKMRLERTYSDGTVMTEQKSSTDLASTKLNRKTNSKKSPEHMSKPSTVFTFEQLKGSAQEETLKNLFDQNLNLTENSDDQALRVHVTGNDEQRQQVAFSGDELQITPGALSHSPTDKSKSSFGKLNGMCISFYKHLTLDAHKTYRAMLTIDSVKYFGSAKTSDEANEIAASNYFQSIQSGTHQQLKKIRKPVTNPGPSSSFNILSEMYAGLHYHVIGRDENSMYRAVVQVDSVNYYGDGIHFQSAANKAADTCLKSINCGRHTKLVNK